MPTQPEVLVLDRDISIEQIKGYLVTINPLLVEILNYSTEILTNSLRSLERNNDKRVDVNVAPILLFLHGMEMLDAEQVLISHSCLSAANIILRSHFETLLSLRFLFDDPAQYERRSLVWQIWAEKNHQKNFRYLRTTSLYLEEWEKAKKTDIFIGGIPIAYFPRLSVSIQEKLELFLQKPKNKEISEEIDRQKKKNHLLKNWFSIDSGPRNIRDLASKMNCEATYLLLYNQISSLAHSNDPIRFIGPYVNSENYPSLLRISEDILFTVYLTVNIQIEMIRLMYEWFHPIIRPDIITWHNIEVQPKIATLFQ